MAVHTVCYRKGQRHEDNGEEGGHSLAEVLPGNISDICHHENTKQDQRWARRKNRNTCCSTATLKGESYRLTEALLQSMMDCQATLSSILDGWVVVTMTGTKCGQHDYIGPWMHACTLCVSIVIHAIIT